MFCIVVGKWQKRRQMHTHLAEAAGLHASYYLFIDSNCISLDVGVLPNVYVVAQSDLCSREWEIISDSNESDIEPLIDSNEDEAKFLCSSKVKMFPQLEIISLCTNNYVILYFRIKQTKNHIFIEKFYVLGTSL